MQCAPTHRATTVIEHEMALLTVYLPQAQREMTVGALLGLSYPTINKDVVTAILEDIAHGLLADHWPASMRAARFSARV